MYEDDLQIVIEKILHALAKVIRKKLGEWIHKKDKPEPQKLTEGDKEAEDDISEINDDEFPY